MGEDASHSPRSEDEREADTLAAQLAYESGWRRCNGRHSAPSRRGRTITVAVLSLTLPAAGGVASLSAIGNPKNGIGVMAAAGWIVVGVAAVCALLAAGRVLRPIETLAALGATKIVENYISPAERGRNPTWVYQHLARDLDNAYEHMHEELGARSFAYKAVLASVFCAFVGAGIVVADALLPMTTRRSPNHPASAPRHHPRMRVWRRGSQHRQPLRTS